MKTTLLIDADGTAFVAASAVQKSIHWDDDILTTHADLDEAKAAFEAEIEKYRRHSDPDADIMLCFSCPTRRYFRHTLLPTYKGNRKSAPPLALKPLREWAMEAYPSRTKPGLEADDVLGILATHPKLIPGKKIIVSADKDLDQIPGLHMNARAPDEGVYRVAPEFSERLLWTQALTGDQTDNYTGIPGCGPAKAAKVLDKADPTEYADRVLAAYLKAGLTAEDMTVQVNVARILTSTTYDFKKKEPVLWQMT